MFSKCNVTDSCSTSTDFSMREITGRWVSKDGHTKVYIYPNTIQKWGGNRLRLTYNNPLVVCDRVLKRWFGKYYINLYGQIKITYNREQEVLHLSAFGEYVREED